MPLGYSLDNIGPMAHTVRDCALMLQVMAGYDPNDECSVNLPVHDMLAGLDGSLAGVQDRRPVAATSSTCGARTRRSKPRCSRPSTR